jgi:predicted nucleotidyltransferase
MVGKGISMVRIESIQALCEGIVQGFHPEKVVLFGSYAYGKPDEGSDVDLLVVMAVEGKAPRIAADMMARLRPSFPVDILVRDPSVLQQRLELGDPFLCEVMRQGKVLYAAS